MKELEKIIKYSKLIIDRNFDDCLEIAFNEYITKYNNDIKQILTNNPLDTLNEEGTKFWSANKRVLIPLPFDSNNELNILYIKKYAEILANSISIQIIDDNNYIKLKYKDFKIEEFTPIKAKAKKKNRYLNNVDNIEDKKLLKKKRAEEIEARLKKQKELFKQLKQTADKIHFLENNQEFFKIFEFEKDNDSDGHIEFLYAASNLRAKNFRIENCDYNKIKMISGKITPAIATTTAAIVGIVSTQLYTLKQTDNINFLRDCNFNLCYNNYIFYKTIDKKIEDIDNRDKIKFIPYEFTCWDFIEINESLTIQKFIVYIKEKYNVDINSINSCNLNIYMIK